MVDWIKHKGLAPFTLPPDYKMNWRGSGSFDIGDIPISKKYNEGNLISSDKNYIWSINSTGNPVTPNRPPNKYWWMNRVGPPIAPVGPHINVPDSLKFAFGIPGGYLIYYYPGGWGGGGSVIGTIVDFYVTSTDPFKVISLVKVYIEDYGTTDWIPLNYEPLPQYWDTAEHLATDFNEEEGYYENAWMSFRCGDVVIVGTIDSEPACVLAFADGVFRIGEDILKLVAMEIDSDDDPVDIKDFYYSMNKQTLLTLENNLTNDWFDFYIPQGPGYVPGKGPDGEDLDLLKLCGPYKELGPFDTSENDNMTVNSNDAIRFYSESYGACIYTPCYSVTHRYSKAWYYTRYYAITIGPMLYVIKINRYEGEHSNSTAYNVSEDLRPLIDQCHPGQQLNYILMTIEELYALTEPTWPEEIISSKSSGNFVEIMATLYSDELYDAFLADPTICENAPFYLQNSFNMAVCRYDDPDWYPIIDWLTPKFYVRPHTLTELMAAGLWP